MSSHYTYSSRPTCENCEIVALGGTLECIGFGGAVVTSIKRKRIFCDSCMSNSQLRIAEQLLNGRLDIDRNDEYEINQITLLTFAFLQFGWEEGKYGKPLKVIDVLPLPEDVAWCDECYVQCFHEYPFFEIEDNRLVFYYRYCGSCSRHLEG